MLLGKIAWKVVAGATFTLIFAAQSFAAPRFMETGAITSQPIGHYEFCQKHKDDCTVHAAGSLAPKITDFGWDIIRGINSSVNQTIVPMTDKEIFGRDEVWSYPTDAGDCEDYVLQKRKELIERGFSAADLLITVVRKPDGEGHAVLTLRSSSGDYILDNLDSGIKLWSQTSYKFLKRQASFNSGRWVTIENSGELLVGAVSN